MGTNFVTMPSKAPALALVMPGLTELSPYHTLAWYRGAYQPISVGLSLPYNLRLQLALWFGLVYNLAKTKYLFS